MSHIEKNVKKYLIKVGWLPYRQGESWIEGVADDFSIAHAYLKEGNFVPTELPYINGINLAAGQWAAIVPVDHITED